MKKYKFRATLEPAGDGGACILFPYEVEAEFGTTGRVPVHATFDGVPYSGSLIKYGHPQHMLGVLKAIRERLGKQLGDTVAVELWRDEQPRTVEVPAAFAARLLQEDILDAFDKLSYTHRKEYIRWITEAKKEETRTARLEKAVNMLKRGIKTPG